MHVLYIGDIHFPTLLPYYTTHGLIKPLRIFHLRKPDVQYG